MHDPQLRALRQQLDAWPQRSNLLTLKPWPNASVNCWRRQHHRKPVLNDGDFG